MEMVTRRLLSGALAGALLLVLLWIGAARPAHGEGTVVAHEADEIVVRLAAGTSLEAIHETHGTTLIRSLVDDAQIYLLQAPEGTSAVTLVGAMSQDSRLLYAELNYVSAAPEAHGVDSWAWTEGDAQASGVDSWAWPEGDAEAQGVDSWAWPEGDADAQGVDSWAWPEDDSMTISSKQSFDWEPDPGDAGRYYNQPAATALHLEQAHTYHRGAGVVVAVLDTGIDLGHGAFAGRLTRVRYDFVGEDAIPQDEFNGIDDDADGQVDEVAGHGTHVAGIVSLVAPDAQIMPLRVLDSDGQGDSAIIGTAMLYAAANGADVINLSLGTPIHSQFLHDVLRMVSDAGVVVVAASGNRHADSPEYPAASACALGVTALNPGDIKEGYANYGAWIDLAAPGERIYSTYPGGQFAWWSGTSMATPFITGQAALLHGFDSSLSGAQISAVIAATAAPVDHKNHDYAGLLGAGRVDVGASLHYLATYGAPSGGELLAGCSN